MAENGVVMEKALGPLGKNTKSQRGMTIAFQVGEEKPAGTV